MQYYYDEEVLTILEIDPGVYTERCDSSGVKGPFNTYLESQIRLLEYIEGLMIDQKAKVAREERALYELKKKYYTIENQTESDVRLHGQVNH